MTLENKIVLVTGATRGIGRAIALQCAKAGAQVIGTATTEKNAQTISDYFKEAKLKGVGKVLNVTDLNSVSQLIDTIKKEFGHINILVNNAGITRDNLMLRMKEEEWQAVIDTNLTSVFRLTRACLSDMIKQHSGRIINISSVVGSSGNPGQANYAAAKAGIIGFSKTVAMEVAQRGVTVNVIAPGFIDTPMTDKLNEKQREYILSRIPMKRIGKPEEIAATVLFLASDEASYITGQALHVNGGLYMP